MRKLMFIAVLAALAAAPAFALDFDAKQFYGQVEATFPMGDWGDFVSLGYGAGLGVLVPHSESTSFGLEASYLMFSTEDMPGADVSWSMIPVLFIGQYHLNNSSAYLLGGVGLAFGMADIDYDDSDAFDVDDSSSDLAIAFGAGINATPKMFFEGRFNAISDANMVGVHMGIRF